MIAPVHTEQYKDVGIFIYNCVYVIDIYQYRPTNYSIILSINKPVSIFLKNSDVLIYHPLLLPPL